MFMFVLERDYIFASDTRSLDLQQTRSLSLLFLQQLPLKRLQKLVIKQYVDWRKVLKIWISS